jgi:EmrB/QacA subfamily drug resistance transporter
MSALNHRQALFTLGLATLLSALGSSIANVALPTLVTAFETSLSAVQWVVLAYLLAITTLVVSTGRLGDLFGRRRVLVIGLLLFSLGSGCCATAPNLGWLIAARALQGLGAAAMMALPLALVADTVDKARTGHAMGLLGTLSAVGTALGPSLGGVLIAWLGWRWLFSLCVPLGLIAALLAQRCLAPAAQTAKQAGFDAMGTIILSLTLATYALAMTHTLPFRPLLLVAAAAGSALFIWHQRRAHFPLLDLSLFADTARSRALLMAALVAAVIMSTLVVGPFYLSQGLGLNAALTGLVMAAGPAMAALSCLPAGHLTERFGAARITRLGLLLMACGCLALALLPQSTGVGGYLVPLLVTTAGYALFQTANNTVVMASIGTHQRGALAGLLNLARNLGLITGASALGAVFISAAMGATATSGLHMSFAVALGLVLLALACSCRPYARAQATAD